MPIPPQLKSSYKRLKWVEKTLIVLIAVYLLLMFLAPRSLWTGLAQGAAIIFAFGVAVRLSRMGIRHAIWRLRNRLIVTYLFIAVVPLLLVVLLASAAVWALASQVAVFLVTSELDRRVESLQAASDSILRTDTVSRADLMRRMADLLYKGRFPGIEMLLRVGGSVERYPVNSTMSGPPEKWGRISGIVRRNGVLYAWSHVKLVDGDFTAIAPLTRYYLSNLVPGLGMVDFLVAEPDKQGVRLSLGHSITAPGVNEPDVQFPPRANRFDATVGWSSLFDIADWNAPGSNIPAFLNVLTRPSAVFNVLFSRKADILQGYFQIALIAVVIIFVIVELFSLVIGVSMTRTITGAVHRLYEGTQSVMRGDFTHRIAVNGNDQLAELGHSFNRMTTRIEELLVVSKEKERLQSELEIAREVQNQLYPKKVPDVQTIRLTAVCKPARMVSGDYFDYECVAGGNVALAIGDVAGKGISAALLMATVQSSLRTELRGSAEMAMAAEQVRFASRFSTSKLVSNLNTQLYKYTSPEKYATFYLGIYDEESSLLTYTNAGHLPPILVRDGQAVRLNVDGTVVGAFPFAQFDESRVTLQAGDLLVCFTDGVSEPENEYGEMFGEARLVDLVIRNAHRSEDQIVATVIAAVEQWTGTAELQDDLTLMLVRRK